MTQPKTPGQAARAAYNSFLFTKDNLPDAHWNAIAQAAIDADETTKQVIRDLQTRLAEAIERIKYLQAKRSNARVPGGAGDPPDTFGGSDF